VPDSQVSVALMYPELLGLYGDRGNAVALAHRAAVRGLDLRVLEVALDSAVPTADIYLLGGGEDAAALVAMEQLTASTAFADALNGGAACLAVCAGLQLLGHSFAGVDREEHRGMGLLDVTSRRLTGPRAVGELLAESVALPELGYLTGFENHQGDATLGPDARPLGRVVRGVGNGDSTEGAVQGHVVATYLHGPVLPRNPALADQLLAWVVGDLAPYDHEAVARLRSERRTAALRGDDDEQPAPLRQRVLRRLRSA
jgi:CobQ-like glutamine amidotransferase family enzyme